MIFYNIVIITALHHHYALLVQVSYFTRQLNRSRQCFVHSLPATLTLLSDHLAYRGYYNVC